MPKRKRNEPGLEEKLAQWRKELVRGLKLAKGFERQRMSKRVREADADKKERLEREIAVLKSLDLHQAANAHLCSSLLKIKGVPESPRLPGDIKQVPRPEGLTDEERAALHNVTSALCNRKQVKDVIEQAIMGTCIALRVAMPEKKGKGKGAKRTDEEPKEAKKEKPKTSSRNLGGEDSDDAEEEEEEEEPILLKRKREAASLVGDEEDSSADGDTEDSDNEEFEGFSDSDAEERAFSRYENLVGGSSDEDDSEEDLSEEGDMADSRSKTIRGILKTSDDISVSSGVSDEEEDIEDGDGDNSEGSLSASPSPPPQKKTKTSKQPMTRAGESAFLPSLMGGYISGSESASDVDVAPPTKKNRMGQRERQAIWEKKYGKKANHMSKQKQSNGREQGWDLRRGAVGGDEEDGGSRPWKKGIKNPFDKNNSAANDASVHPDRRRQLDGGNGPRRSQNTREGSGDNRTRDYNDSGHRGFAHRDVQPAKPTPAPTKRDDIGVLHPSWAAAKKAKEEGSKIAFQGKKVTFD